MNKIFLLGDSVMKGVTYSGEPEKYHLCSGQRYKKLTEQGAEVNNISRMNATIKYADQTLTESFLENLNGASIITGFGGNDCDYNWDLVSAEPDGTHFPKTPVNEYTKVYSDCISRMKNAGAKVYIASLVPIDAERYMKWIAKGREYDNLLKWLGDPEMLYRWHEYYDHLTEKLAYDSNCPMIDLRGAFLTDHTFTSLISNDGIHPTEEGHKLIEDTITSSVINA